MDVVYYYSDEDELLEPVWLSQPRGFIDARSSHLEKVEAVLDGLPHSLNTFWSTTDGDRWTIEIDEVTVQLTGCLDISCSPGLTVEGSMPRRLLDPLRAELREMVSEKLQDVESRLSAFSLVVFLLQLTEVVAASTLDWKPDADLFDNYYSQRDTWGASDTISDDWQTLITTQTGLNLTTVSDVALHILRQPIATICASIPSWLRILHVEPVFRNNLVTRFLDRQAAIRDSLSDLSLSALRSSIPAHDLSQISRLDRHSDLLDHLSTPRVTFHGAPRQIIPSIVRHGFLKPGSTIRPTTHIQRSVVGDTVHTRCGATYGYGIYSSPSPTYASRYTTYERASSPVFGTTSTSASQIPGLRLLVCATLPGRSQTVTRSTAYHAPDLLGGPGSHYHSHVSADGYEYVVFDAAQIIPCYVLHLDYGADIAKAELARLPDDPREFERARARQERREERRERAREEDMFPGVAKDAREERKAGAMKWFPYGYGPATGTRFVVEEVGEVSEDEEVYGDYQELRVEGEGGKDSGEWGRKTGGSWFDEYQLVRKAKD